MWKINLHLPVWSCLLQRPRREKVSKVLQNPRAIALQEAMSEALAVERLQLQSLLLQVGLIEAGTSFQSRGGARMRWGRKVLEGRKVAMVRAKYLGPLAQS